MSDIDIVDELRNPEEFYPDNFQTAMLANAFYSGLCQDAADEIESLRKQVKELEKNAARWKYTQQDRYFVIGPYDTDGDFQGYSVGVEPLIPDNIHWKERAKYGGLNQWIKGQGDTLEAALDEAIAKDVK